MKDASINVKLPIEFDERNKELFAIFIKNLESYTKYRNSKDFFENQTDQSITILTDRVLTCANSIAKLLGMGFLEEATMLFRSFFETTVNIGFMNCSSSEVTEMMYDYTRQNLYRQMNQEIDFAEVKVTIKSNPQIIIPDEIESLIKTYSTKKGKPIKEWSRVAYNIEKRLTAIKREFEGKYSQLLPLLFIHQYQGASELLHGSLDGALRFLTGYNSKVKHENVKEIVTENRTGILILLLQSAC